MMRTFPESASGWESGAAGAVASMLAKTIVFPLDLVRKRLQVQGPTRDQYVHRNIPVYQGVVGALRDIRRLEGWKGWYKGLTISLLKAAPSSAVSMFVFEHAMRFLQQRSSR
jgi:solute carrier family 25 thiamine pyrophosphate transporter 19